MLIIHAIKSNDLFDLYFRDTGGLCWFGVLPGDCNPKEYTAVIYRLFAICEPELASVYPTCEVYVYRKEK